MSLAVAPLVLSGGDRAELERLARSGDRRMAERARIIMACADSPAGNSGVAAELGLSVETVRKWRGGGAGRAGGRGGGGAGAGRGGRAGRGGPARRPPPPPPPGPGGEKFVLAC